MSYPPLLLGQRPGCPLILYGPFHWPREGWICRGHPPAGPLLLWPGLVQVHQSPHHSRSIVHRGDDDRVRTMPGKGILAVGQQQFLVAAPMELFVFVMDAANRADELGKFTIPFI